MATENAARAIADLAQSGIGIDPFGEELLRILEGVVGADAGILCGLDGNPPLVTRNLDETKVAIIERATRLAPTRYASDLSAPTQAFLRTGAALDHELFTEHEREQLPIFREVVRPAGLDSLLFLCLRWRREPMMLIHLSRGGGQAFDAGALDRALDLLPTIELAMAAIPSASAEALLTPREREIASHVARGLTTPQIAQVLGLSRYTVRNQLFRIFDKLKVASRSELAALYASRRPPFFAS